MHDEDDENVLLELTELFYDFRVYIIVLMFLISIYDGV